MTAREDRASGQPRWERIETNTLQQYGVCVTNYGDVASAEAIIGTAKLAEEVGFDSVWVSDHVVVPPTFGYTYGSSFMDPFICLSYAAAETQRVKLGTTVVVVPLRNPFVQAKMLSTLDVLSGGRIIFGVGVGWISRSSRLSGSPFIGEGNSLTNTLRIIQAFLAYLPASIHPGYARAPRDRLNGLSYSWAADRRVRCSTEP